MGDCLGGHNSGNFWKGTDAKMPVWGTSCAVQVPITVVNGTIYGTDGQATTLKGVNWCVEGPRH